MLSGNSVTDAWTYFTFSSLDASDAKQTKLKDVREELLKISSYDSVIEAMPNLYNYTSPHIGVSGWSKVCNAIHKKKVADVFFNSVSIEKKTVANSQQTSSKKLKTTKKTVLVTGK